MFAYFEFFVDGIFDNDGGQEFDSISQILLFVAEYCAEYKCTQALDANGIAKYENGNKAMVITVSKLS